MRAYADDERRVAGCDCEISEIERDAVCEERVWHAPRPREAGYERRKRATCGKPAPRATTPERNARRERQQRAAITPASTSTKNGRGCLIDDGA